MKTSEYDAVIVGAGFAGLYMLHRLRGLGLSAIVFETGSDVGGTWYWNRYPGARCDVESMQYSFSFSDELQQTWRWSERFSPQPEILAYAKHVADRFDLRRDIRFETRVTAAAFDDQDGCWTVQTDKGDAVRARFVIMATGCLSAGRTPEIEGMDSFRGATYHTGEWPHAGVNLAGKRVAVIGTGSSAIQAIPVIAEQAAQLFVFQRTPNYSLPTRNRTMTEEYERDWKENYDERRAQARRTRTGTLYKFGTTKALETDPEARRREYDARWEMGGIELMVAFTDLIIDKQANETAAEYVREKIRAAVHDPAVAESLVPTSYPIGTKRICVDSHYFETYNRDNVTLVDLRRTPIERITENGVQTSQSEYAVDAIVFATGFDAMTGSLLKIDITGAGGARLRDKWEAGPRTLLGLMVAGFPNMFTITGPGSPSVLCNMIVAIEQHVDWIADCLADLRARGAERIEAMEQAQTEWVEHVNEVAYRTLYPQANSWYMGANIPGKPRVFMPYIGGLNVYRDKCAEIAAQGYPGFRLSPSVDAPQSGDPADMHAPELPVFAAP